MLVPKKKKPEFPARENSGLYYTTTCLLMDAFGLVFDLGEGSVLNGDADGYSAEMIVALEGIEPIVE
jgi:hypothetical protein